MATITKFKSACDDRDAKPAEQPVDKSVDIRETQSNLSMSKQPVNTSVDSAKGVRKPIKSIIKPSANTRPKSPLRVMIKNRQPTTTTQERARIVMERGSRHS